MLLYKAYYKAMYNTAFRILRDSFDAEDIMQEAFLSVFKKIDSYKGEVAFGAWLKRIVINKCLTQLKQNKKYNDVKLDVVSNEVDQEETINYSEIKADEIIEKINTLKQNYSMVLNLHLIEGYDYEEISEILNYTNENVRTTISRAKKKLKQILLQELENKTIYGRQTKPLF